MKNTNWLCPKHHLKLYTIEDYPGAYLCPAGAAACPDIFVVIDGHLCKNEHQEYVDVETGEKRIPPEYKPVKF